MRRALGWIAIGIGILVVPVGASVAVGATDGWDGVLTAWLAAVGTVLAIVGVAALIAWGLDQL